jgi:hypothetical protein
VTLLLTIKCYHLCGENSISYKSMVTVPEIRSALVTDELTENCGEYMYNLGLNVLKCNKIFIIMSKLYRENKRKNSLPLFPYLIFVT